MDQAGKKYIVGFKGEDWRSPLYSWEELVREYDNIKSRRKAEGLKRRDIVIIEVKEDGTERKWTPTERRRFVAGAVMDRRSELHMQRDLTGWVDPLD